MTLTPCQHSAARQPQEPLTACLHQKHAMHLVTARPSQLSCASHAYQP